jgi:hypothetical protein
VAESLERFPATVPSMTAPPDLYSFENLHHHCRTCRRNKRNTRNALRFEINAEANLLALAQELGVLGDVAHNWHNRRFWM